MKKIALFNTILLCSLFVAKAGAQVRVNINIGQPVYASAVPAAVSYYYLPDVQAYYHVPAKVYYYKNRGRWVSGRRLPGYRNYDVYSRRHIAVHEHRPYLRHNHYYAKYNKRAAHHYGRPGKGHPHKGRKAHTHRRAHRY